MTSDSTTRAILKQIGSMGYAVSVHRVNESIEMHAVLLAAPENQHIARCADDDGIESEYRAACVLAEMVGIDLMD